MMVDPPPGRPRPAPSKRLKKRAAGAANEPPMIVFRPWLLVRPPEATQNKVEAHSISSFFMSELRTASYCRRRPPRLRLQSTTTTTSRQLLGVRVRGGPTTASTSSRQHTSSYYSQQAVVVYLKNRQEPLSCALQATTKPLCLLLAVLWLTTGCARR